MWNEKFGVDATNFTTPTGTADTAIYLHANAAGEIGECNYLSGFGSGVAAAADRQHTMRALLSTAATAGTAGSSPTPEPMRNNAHAASFLVGIEYTAEPTVLGTVSKVLLSFNQRGGLPWAMPMGEGIILANSFTDPAMAWTVVSDAAGAVDGNAEWWEL